MNNIAIIGGGASGLVSAIVLARAGVSVTVYERLDRVGKKLLSTGNGRCNLSNISADLKDYHGSGGQILQNAIDSFWVQDTLIFFEGLGLITKCEQDGKIYPYSDRAASVLDVLRMELARLKVHIEYGCEISKIKRIGGGFELFSDNARYSADRVILACGGKASPSLGSNGSGYALAKSLGHTVTNLKPAIVQLKTNPDLVRSLKGIKVNANVEYNGESYTGELLFTDYGISGPPAFCLSSYYAESLEATIDFMYEYSYPDIVGFLTNAIARVKALSGTLEDIFVGILNKRIGMQLIKAITHRPSDKAVDFTEQDARSLARVVKAYRIPITGLMSWNNAQVTSGGVLCSEINPQTLESKKCKGLYFTGELLDVDGNCGGYNLQFAWSTGYIAAKAILGKYNG